MANDHATTTLRVIVEAAIRTRFPSADPEWAGDAVAWRYRGSRVRLANTGGDIWAVDIDHADGAGSRFGRHGLRSALATALEDCQSPAPKGRSK